MSHKPRRLVRHAQHPMKLMGTHPLLGRTEKMNSQQPLVQGNVAILENRIYGDGELLLTVLALPHPGADWLLAVRLRGQLVSSLAIAMRTHGAIRPAKRLKKLTGFLSVLEVRGFGQIEHRNHLDDPNLRFFFRFVKYIITQFFSEWTVPVDRMWRQTQSGEK